MNHSNHCSNLAPTRSSHTKTKDSGNQPNLVNCAVMGDVAQILGVQTTDPGSDKGLPQLLRNTPADRLPPIVPTNTGAATNTTKTSVVKVGSKWISSQKRARKWAWTPFSSSSRTDGLLLHHWVRANVEYPDYPYGTCWRNSIELLALTLLPTTCSILFSV